MMFRCAVTCRMWLPLRVSDIAYPSFISSQNVLLPLATEISESRGSSNIFSLAVTNQVLYDRGRHCNAKQRRMLLCRINNAAA